MSYSGDILVAEDNSSNQMLITLLLKKLGFDVTIADDGQIACDIFDTKPFVMVLMDMMMPNMNGYEATAELRKRGVKIPIIAVTANAMAGDREKCLNAGCDEYVTKPINLASLEKAISMFLNDKNNADITENNENNVSSNDDNGPIISDLASDPDLYVVAELFVDRLKEILDSIKAALADDNQKALKDLFHEIKGAGGSAGFQILTDKAMVIEKLVLADDKPNRDAAIDEFFKICSRVKATTTVGAD